MAAVCYLEMEHFRFLIYAQFSCGGNDRVMSMIINSESFNPPNRFYGVRSPGCVIDASRFQHHGVELHFVPHTFRTRPIGTISGTLG